MKFSVAPFSLSYLNAELQDRSNHKRSPGLHVSDIIRDLSNRVVHKGRRQSTSELTAAELQQMNYYTEVGFSWEALLEKEFKLRMLARREDKYIQRQAELLYEGIYMSPDAVDYTAEDVVLEEYKATWTSMKKMATAADFLQEKFEWDTQVRCYLQALGLTKVRFIVLWVNGDYNDRRPCARQYDVEYEVEEVEEAWSMVKNHGGLMQREGKVG